ncbi:MAG TPA: hypothetical protein VKQ30_02920, partial [Ktedonobacterales bacterium]|nr:hypothetical protein [Ktedonobacterales bacterium]
SRIRTLYTEVASIKRPAKNRGASTSSKNKTKHEIKLEPVGYVDEALLNPYAPPNPYALRTLYGDHQLQLALDRYSLTKLKEAVVLVQKQNPGTKPKNMGRKESVLDYIVEHVAGASS